MGRVAQQPFDSYVTEHILRPLGMSHSQWEASSIAEAALARPHATSPDGALRVIPEWRLGASAGAGGIYSSIEDMARFVAFQLAAWPGSNAPESPVLARSSLREAHSMQALDGFSAKAPSGQPLAAQVNGEGLGWAVYGDCRFEHVVWHNGGTEGHRAAVYLLPARGIGLILLANKDGVDLDAAARSFLARLHDGGVLPQRERVPILSELWRERVSAVWQLGEAFDADRYEALFHPIFRQAVPAETLRPLLLARRAELGRCRVGAPLQSHHDIWLAATLECEQRAMVVEAGLMPNGQLVGLWLGDPAEHKERVSERPQSAPRACP